MITCDICKAKMEATDRNRLMYRLPVEIEDICPECQGSVEKIYKEADEYARVVAQKHFDEEINKFFGMVNNGPSGSK